MLITPRRRVEAGGKVDPGQPKPGIGQVTAGYEGEHSPLIAWRARDEVGLNDMLTVVVWLTEDWVGLGVQVCLADRRLPGPACCEPQLVGLR